MKALNQEEITMLCDSYKLHGSLRAVSRLRVRSVATVKKYVSKYMEVKTQNIVKKLATRDERLIGLYVGLWLGDGTQYKDKGRCVIKICCNRENRVLNTFVQDVIFRTFEKKTALIEENSNNRAFVKFVSKFIFNFIYKCTKQDLGKKTYSVRLKEEINQYGDDFLEGCLLGLVLSDGYLKDFFSFNVTSKGLSHNMFNILKKYGFKPSVYVHKRAKWGWKDLNMVRLNKKKVGN